MLTSADLANLRAAQVLYMLDTGYVQTYARTFNTMNEPVETWTEAATATACGLDMRPGAERHQADKTVTEYDATLRLPLTVTIDAKDRVRITHRFGEALAVPLIFEVSSPVQRGPSGLRVLLRKVDA